MKPKYSIVRIDDSLYCPSHFEKINNEFVCEYDGKNKSCSNCRYGDTKTQLIDKITTVINREMLSTNDFVILGGNKPFAKILSHKQLAQKIVEFLGVEE